MMVNGSVFRVARRQDRWWARRQQVSSDNRPHPAAFESFEFTKAVLPNVHFSRQVEM